MDRYWLLTNTCYGNWLPGDRRGFVGQVWEHRPGETEDDRRITHDIPGVLYDSDLPGLERASQQLLKGKPVCLTMPHADNLFDQFQETAAHRGWQILAIAIMSNHFHLVVGVPCDPDPGKILGDFKSWGTRRLTREFGAPQSQTWWTERGSKRKLADETSIHNAVHYVLYDQPHPLLTWSPETGLHHVKPPRT